MARFTGYKKASLFRHSLDCSLQKDMSAKLPGGEVFSWLEVYYKYSALHDLIWLCMKDISRKQ